MKHVQNGEPIKHHKEHIPVLLTQAIAALNVKDDHIYVDGTFGRGGYSREILNTANCTVYGIDRDPTAVAVGKDLEKEFSNRFTMIHGCFGDMDQLLKKENIDQIDGIVLDLGVSSAQIDQPSRGFSFKKDGPLDMRMSCTGETAADIVNDTDEEELANIIYEYGEEHHSRKIAKAIVQKRAEKPFSTTTELADCVRGVVYQKGKKDPATKTFQALRIAVNAELDELDKALNHATNLLKNKGRLAVVSFHSLEDRKVKSFLKEQSGENNKQGSRHLPHIESDFQPRFKVIKKSSIKANKQETDMNKRARSARLRVAERMRNDQ